jgi:transglutaminase-like putative cysteine protease
MNAAWILRRFPAREITALSLLAVGIGCLINGLGTTVRGATLSVFLPVGLWAALFGWTFSVSRFNGWVAAASTFLAGVVLIWVSTAQLDRLMLQEVTSAFILLVTYIQYLRGGPAPDLEPLQNILATMAQQGTGLWQRLLLWITCVWNNVAITDAVVSVMAWSLGIWLVCAWAGWALRRRDAMTALTPALVILAIVADYTGLNNGSVWLLIVIMLFLLGLGRYSANVRAWTKRGTDYAEFISSNTMISLIFVITLLAAATWMLPNIEIQEIIESLRRKPSSNTAPQSLGLVNAHKAAPGSAYGQPVLPRLHMLTAGQERSQDTVFTVRTGELPPIPMGGTELAAPHHYWRSQTFDRYNGFGWSTSETEKQTIPAGDPFFTTLPPGYKLLKQDFTLYQPGDQTLYWDGMLYSADQSLDASWRIKPTFYSSPLVDLPFNDGDLYSALRTSPSYHVESYIPNAGIEQLRAAGQNYPQSIQDHYLALPKNIPERVFGLARKLTATGATPFDQAVIIETYLRVNYPYTLKIDAPPANVEVADYFLFDLKKGYCDYYATAMVVLARAAGLPARFVTGYAGGNYNTRTAAYTVVEAQAHSWAEIYFPGIGWVEFEPTASQPEINRPSEHAGRAPNATLPPLSPLGILKQMYATLPPLARWGVTIPGVLLLLWIVYLIVEDFVLKHIRPVLALRWIFRDIYRVGGKLAGELTPATTVTEFCEALLPQMRDDTYIRLLTATYLQALFSPRPVSAQQVRSAIKAWRSIRWRLFFSRRRTA